MGQSNLLLIVICTIFALSLFLWLSTEHRRQYKFLNPHTVHSGKPQIRLFPYKQQLGEDQLFIEEDHAEQEVSNADLLKGHCDPSFKVVSSLKNGVVTIDRSDLFCYGRCIEAPKEYRGRNVLKPWEDVEFAVFACEIVEVVCLGEEDPERVEYRMLHRQFLNIREFTSEPATPPQKANVLVFFLDNHYAEGFLSKSLETLEETMVEVTGMGENLEELKEIPQLYGIFTGLRDRKKKNNELCNMFLGNQTYRSKGVFQKAEEQGYVTMFNDDSFHGIFKTLDCPPPGDPVADHSLESFYVYTWYNWFMKYIFHGKGCQFTYKDTLDLLKEVWKAYPDRPIFSLNLISTVSHRKKYRMSLFDNDLRDFLKDPLLSDTMIILATLGGSESEFRIFKGRGHSLDPLPL